MSLRSREGCRAAAERWLDGKPRRLAHVRGVAALATELARRAQLGPEDAEALVRVAWLHDVGYAEALSCTGFHPLDGAEWVRARGEERLARLVAHHSLARLAAAERGLDLGGYPREEGAVADLLDYADLCTSPDGRRVTAEDRLEEIEARRGDPLAERPLRLALARKVEEMLRGCGTMRVLVAGGSRFIGRHLVEFLLDEGHDVTLFNRGQTNPELFPEAARIHGDRADPPAALGQHDWDWVFDVSAYVEEELTPLVRAVGPRTRRYLYVSTGGVYMPSPNVEITEDSAQWPAEERYLGEGAPNAYGAKKAKAERALWRMAPEYGMEVAVIRPVVVYGPWDPTDRCHYWLHRVKAGTVVVPEAPAAFTRCVYVKDLVRELIAAAKAPHAANRAYNAAQTRHRSLQEWIDTAAAVLGTTPRVRAVSWEDLKEAGVERLPAVGRAPARIYSTARAQAELGLTSTPFAQTVAECFAHMEAEGRPIAEGIPTDVLARLMR